MKVYVIVGCTGEYEDRKEWVVSKAFTDEDRATAFAKQLDDLGKVGERKGTLRIGDFQRERDVVLPKLQELDPKATIDNTGTQYVVEEAYLDEGDK